MAIPSLFVPEQSPVTDRQQLLMQRPWLDWCRRVTQGLQEVDNGGGGGGTGDVVGPSMSTNDAIAIYNGITGKIIKDSLKTIASVVTDAVNAAIAAILPGGTLPVGNLPANVAFEDQANTFTQENIFTANQIMQGNLHVDGNLDADGDIIGLADLNINGQALIAGGLGMTPLDASQLSSGTVPDARLAANIQRKPMAAADLPAHATRHQQGGADPIKLDDLASPEDNTDLNATIALHGLLPKLNNNPLHYLNGQGAWVAATGSGLGDVTGPAGPVVDSVFALFNGTTGKIIKDTNASARGWIEGPASASLAWRDKSQAADAKVFDAVDVAGQLRFRALNDAATVVQSTPLTLRRDGGAIVGTVHTFNPGWQQMDVAAPAIVLNDTSQPANQKLFQLRNSTGGFRIWAQNDGGAMLSETVIDRSANLYVGAAIAERGRAAYLGEWITVPYSAGNFASANGDAAWVVEAGDVLLNRYTLIGKTMIWTVSITNSAITGVGASRLLITLPGGFSGTVTPMPVAWVSMGSPVANVTVESESATQLKIWRDRGGQGFPTFASCIVQFTAVVILT